jgi:hypothetical protein
MSKLAKNPFCFLKSWETIPFVEFFTHLPNYCFKPQSDRLAYVQNPASHHNHNTMKKLATTLTIALLFTGLISCKKEPTTPVVSNPPAAVQNLNGMAQDGVDSIYWTANFTSEGVTSYNVYAGTSASALTLAGTSTTTSFRHTGLTNGTTYYYVVAAVNGAGEGPRNQPISLTPQVARNKAYSMYVSQTLPGGLKAAPYRYYNPNDKYYGNPYVNTDNFAYIINAFVYEGFQTNKMYEDFKANNDVIPSKYVLVDNYRLPRVFADSRSYTKAKTLSQIEQWADGLQGGYLTDLYGPDTIPVAFYVKGDISGKIPADMVKSVRIRAEHHGIVSMRADYVPYIDKVINISDFAHKTDIAVFDKKTPTVYNTPSGWLFVIPVVGQSGNTQNGSTLPTVQGYREMAMQVTYADNTQSGKTLFGYPTVY